MTSNCNSSAPVVDGRHPRAHAPGFTLIEVTLAALIGSLVLIAAVGVWTAIGKVDQRHKIRVKQTDDYSRAYLIIERSLAQLVMSHAPDAGDAEALRRIERDIRRNDGEALAETETDRDRARFVLMEDYGSPAVLEAEGRSTPAQVLRLALRTPPVAGGSGAGDATMNPAAFERRAIERQARERVIAQRRAERRASSSERPESSSSSSSRRSPATVGGEEADPANPGAATDEEQEDEALEETFEELRAPGVWGEFIVLPDGQKPDGPEAESVAKINELPPATAYDDAGNPLRGYTLWYREQPARSAADELSPEERERALRGEALDREFSLADLAYEQDPASLRKIRLISGLRTCRWRVYRRERYDTQMTALASRELPAYVELQLETVGGRKDNWMFEVGWSTGPEPGERLNSGGDLLGGPRSQGRTESNVRRPDFSSGRDRVRDSRPGLDDRNPERPNRPGRE